MPPPRLKNRSNPLNLMQQAFVDALLADPSWSPKEAARKAGYKSPASVGTKLMANPLVQAAIGRAVNARNKRKQVTQDEVLDELAGIAYFDIGAMADENGVPKPVHELPPEVRRAVKSVTVRIGQDGNPVWKIEPCDKVAALALLAKHVGIGGPEQHLHLHKHGADGPTILDWSELYDAPTDPDNVVVVPEYKPLPAPTPTYDIEEVGDAVD